MKERPHERVTSKYSQAVQASLVSTLPTSLSSTLTSLLATQYHLFFGLASSVFVSANTTFCSLKMGILCERKLPFIIYLNEKQLHARIAHKQTPDNPVDSASLAKLKYYTNHLQHVLVHSSHKFKGKLAEATESFSLIDALAPKLTNFFFVPVNHWKNSDLINYKLLEGL